MTTQTRGWTWQRTLILLLALYTLGVSAIGNVSVLRKIGQVELAAWFYWDPGDACYRVSPLSSPKWPPLASGRLKIGDCLTRVDGAPMWDVERMRAHLRERFAALEREAEVEGYRDGRSFRTRVELIRWTLGDLMQAQLLTLIPGLAIWIIGFLVFWAQPDAAANRYLALLLLLTGMLLMGINFWSDSWHVTATYALFQDKIVRVFMGVLLFRVALEFPEPVTHSRLKRLPYLGVALAVAVWLLYAVRYLVQLSDRTGVWIENVADGYVVLSFVAAGLFFVVRALYLQRRHPNPRIKRQTMFLILAWLSSLPLLFLDALSTLPGHTWPLTHVSNLAAAGWLVPGVAMLAYAMLRYQAFAYRGQLLALLLVFFISATLVQVYTTVVTLGQVDGVQWALVWGAVLLTTALFYFDTPLRRSFARYFAPHYHYYESVAQFSRQIGSHQEMKALLHEAARMLCLHLEVAWVGVWSPLAPETVFLASWQDKIVRRRKVAGPPDDAWFGEPPVHVERLAEGGKDLGRIWFGPRVTAEPFDDADRRLAHLLAQELARVMALRSYIEQLEATPALILSAVDQERQRIGRDIHDGVLQFLGVLPLSLERVKGLITRDPGKAAVILDGLVEQAQRVNQEARAIVYDLRLPGVQQGNLVEQVYRYARAVCDSADVQLLWDVNRPEVWARVKNEAAVHVYRIVQEGVHNAIRHGQPRRIGIVWSVDGDQCVLEIRDDGKGLPAAPSQDVENGLGMVSMRERARALGGELTVASRAEWSMVLRLRFPAPKGGGEWESSS